MSWHPYHLIERSPWPLTGSLSALVITSGLIEMMHLKTTFLLKMALLLTALTMFQWWRDITREATFQGSHTMIVKIGLKWGMSLFILSEIMFFFSFFWAFFHASLAPDIEIGNMWPPKGILPFNPFSIPLLNTSILLASGVTVTWSHHTLLMKNYNNFIKSISLTVILGVIFSILQMLEYNEAPFNMSDSIFATTFFVSTGFHGMHVIIGTLFLTYNLIRAYLGQLTMKHHFSFEAAAWYWHFVDVVWLFLFTFMYWWTF